MKGLTKARAGEFSIPQVGVEKRYIGMYESPRCFTQPSPPSPTNMNAKPAYCIGPRSCRAPQRWGKSESSSPLGPPGVGERPNGRRSA
jgi:hypothetical protein